MNWTRSRTLRVTALISAMLVVSAEQTGANSQSLTERPNRGLVEVIAGRADSTAIRMVEDLADVLDDSGTRRVLPVVGKGALQDIADVRALRGIDIALVQVDVLSHIQKQKLYPGIEQSLTYVAKLDDEEFHLLARDDIKSVEDLAGKKVNFGASGEGVSLTGPAIFDLIKIRVQATFYGSSLALEKLRSGEIAALAYIGGKPAPLFNALKLKDGFHLLAVPMNPGLVGTYVPTQLTDKDYPGLIATSEPIDTVAVGTAMMVANLVPASERYRAVVNFVDAFFTQFPHLQEMPHHPKWREVNFAAELPGWKRFPAADAWLKRNVVASVSTPNEEQLREIFVKFLDERSRLAGGRGMSAQEKDDTFNQFKDWQSSRRTR
jgi:uncharacterized protein